MLRMRNLNVSPSYMPWWTSFKWNRVIICLSVTVALTCELPKLFFPPLILHHFLNIILIYFSLKCKCNLQLFYMLAITMRYQMRLYHLCHMHASAFGVFLLALLLKSRGYHGCIELIQSWALFSDLCTQGSCVGLGSLWDSLCLPIDKGLKKTNGGGAT